MIEKGIDRVWVDRGHGDEVSLQNLLKDGGNLGDERCAREDAIAHRSIRIRDELARDEQVVGVDVLGARYGAVCAEPLARLTRRWPSPS